MKRRNQKSFKPTYRPQAAYKDSEEPTMPLHPFGLLLSKDGIVCMALVSIPWSYRFLPFPLQSITFLSTNSLSLVFNYIFIRDIPETGFVSRSIVSINSLISLSFVFTLYRNTIDSEYRLMNTLMEIP